MSLIGSENVSQLSNQSDVPTWISRLFMDDELEELDNFHFALKPMAMSIREWMWWFAAEMIGSRAKGGVTSQACRILERYLGAFTRKNQNLSPSEWLSKKNEIKENLPLLKGVCIMLASKMDSSHCHVNGSWLLRGLQRLGDEYTLAEINKAEWNVFTTIDFWIPVWTNVEKSEMLVTALNSPGCALRVVALIMDLVDMQLPIVYEKIRLHAIYSPSPDNSSEARSVRTSIAGVMNVRTLHLVAAVVVATFRFIRSPRLDIVPTIALWCRVPQEFISWLGNVILEFMLKQDKEVDANDRQDAAITIEDDSNSSDSTQCRNV